jgi:N-acetylneuraminate lyase
MGSIYEKMLQAYHKGEMEKVIALQGEADAIYKILLSYNGIISGKEIMRLIGVDCGPVRKPLRPLSKTDSDALLRKLNQTTFFQHTPKQKNTTANII